MPVTWLPRDCQHPTKGRIGKGRGRWETVSKESFNMFTLLNCETLIFFTKIWVKGTRLRVQDGRFYSTEGKARQKRREAPPGPKAARSAAPSDRPKRAERRRRDRRRFQGAAKHVIATARVPSSTPPRIAGGGATRPLLLVYIYIYIYTHIIHFLGGLLGL